MNTTGRRPDRARAAIRGPRGEPAAASPDATAADDTLREDDFGTGAQPAATRGVAAPASLLLADGGRLPLLRDELQIGRRRTNDIVLDDPTIADQHARLRRLADGWILAGLDGGDETAVNGQPVTRPVFLVAGDTIRLGRLVVVFQPGAGESAGRPTGGVGHQRAPWNGHEAAEAPAIVRPRPATPLIRLDSVVKTYPTSAGPLTVLRGVSLAVQPGEFVAIVGPSGCGKSTLLNVIVGIDRPDAGDVIVDDRDIHQMPADALTRWRGRAIGIVFQFFQLLPTLTAAENVMLPMALCDTYRGPERRARALRVLRQVGVAYAADRLPSVLSGGEQQRVAIARALANNPPLLVADEPTGNLDRQTGRQIFALFAQLIAAGTTVLTVTHDPELARLASRRIEMCDGRIVGASGHDEPAPAPAPATGG